MKYLETLKRQVRKNKGRNSLRPNWLYLNRVAEKIERGISIPFHDNVILI